MKKLPLGHPPISSYLFHAYPLSILAQENRYLPWFYNSHIQLFSFPGEELKFYTHPFSTQHEICHLYYQACPLLDVQSIDRDTLTPSAVEFIRWIKDRIEQGYYVQIDVDFYDLPNKPHYQCSHFIHEVLISGYDDIEQVFSVSGYDEKGYYTTEPLSFAIVQKALSWNKEMYLQQVLHNDQQMPPWFAAAMQDRPRVFLYKYLGEQTTLLDISSINEQLDDYLLAHNTAERYRSLARPRLGGTWGIGIYKILKEHLEVSGCGPTIFTPIIWRILWEHKKCMLGRLCLLEARQVLIRPLSKHWMGLVHQVNDLRLVLLRAQHRRPVAPTKRIEALNAIADQEYELLVELQSQL